MKIFEASKFLIKSTLLKPFYGKPKVWNSDKTIDYILSNKCSVSRFGDGEMSLMEGRNLKFQNFNSEIQNRLKEVKSTDNCLVCIPDVFGKNLNKNMIISDEYKFWKYSNIIFGGMWRKQFSKITPLGDSLFTRFYLRYKDKSKVGDYIIKLKKLWDKRNVIIVEGYTSQVGVGNDILDNAKSIRRILCPNKNAFDYYESIYNSVIENYNDGDLIILALGPTATVLAYDLSKKGIQALDMGHFDIEYEWYLAKTDIKIPVKNKHVNECNSMGMSPVDNDEYKKQIISTILENK